MKKYIITLFIILACMTQAVSQSPVVAPAQKQTIMLTGGTIHTGTGDVITDGTVVDRKSVV